MKGRIKRIAICILALLLTASVSAQFGGFEIASVKPSDPASTGPIGMVVPALGRLTATNATLRRLVYAAYQLQSFQVVGGPAWQNTNRFEINAKAIDGSATTDQILELLKTLLADRFKLKVHTETREVPIYELAIARNDGKTGAKLKLSAGACPDVEAQEQQEFERLAKGGPPAEPTPGDTRPCSITLLPSRAVPGSLSIQARGQTMRSLALALTTLVGRLVVDKTGLTELYDFDLTVDRQTMTRLTVENGGDSPRPQPAGLPEAPALITQLQEDLGLKLDSQRGPGQVLVIDSAELPTSN